MPPGRRIGIICTHLVNTVMENDHFRRYGQEG
ncbi:hypothetical protein PM3016_2955 [Paenibacillus mucilaginosus 3016]|uniref:Uncharacterized protein n=1 Tax=Paenibacillus mucilaginosus 3016 TaxID=1116391 RepID=H6NMF9_9BACL|nr:hypothetical protein PM3016_2955 [Paenibacillus mucilaginosus 3016]